MDQSTPQRGYAICTEARSGSNFLGQMLASTGILGRPEEYFNGAGRRMFDDPNYPDDPEAQVGEILIRGASPNGVYGMKVFAGHFDRVAHTRWALRLPNLKFIYLQRRDLLGQALSLARAQQTMQFRSTRQALREAQFDLALINDHMVQIVRAHARWQFYFAKNGLDPLTLAYEDVLADPDGAVAAVARLMDVDPIPKPDLSKVRVEIQRDEVTEEWRRRFIAESYDITAFH